jgi:hypothetical protein
MKELIALADGDPIAVYALALVSAQHHAKNCKEESRE